MTDTLPTPTTTDLELWSVTTIMGALHKEAIIYWACEQAANCAIDSENTWKAMLNDEGRDAAVKWIRDARQPSRLPKLRLSDTALGTVVHKVCETYALSQKKPDREFAEQLVRGKGGPQVDVDSEVRLVGVMLNHFDAWLQKATPVYQATEMTVYNTTYGYAGTLDALLTIDGVRFITDYKSTRNANDRQGKPKTPYEDQIPLQLAAYRNAEFAAAWPNPRTIEKFYRRYYLLSPDEQELAEPMPEVDTGLEILITPEWCKAFPVRCDALYNPDGSHHPDSIFAAFLYTQEAFRWLNKTCKNRDNPVVGDELMF